MTKPKIGFTRFDAAEYLETEEDMAEFLAASLEMGDLKVFLAALSTVARAKGMTKLAQEVGVARESLYKTLAAETKPRFETVFKLSRALGYPLTIAPRNASSPPKASPEPPVI